MEAPAPPASGEQLARASLRLDALYCAGASAILIVAGSPIARALRIPPAAVRAAGLATGAWAGIVGKLSEAPQWRPSVGAVAAANVIAATGLAAFGLSAPRRVVKTLVMSAATEVALFAASQLMALNRVEPATA